jgi:protein-S-isoprenylcysteine O-methyltransferase Ste14
MGCLFEIFIEIFIEGILNLVMFIYLKLAYMLVPNKKISEKTETKVRNIITIVSLLLVLSLFIGLTFLLPGDAALNAIGKYMTFIPLSIIGLQVVLSIVVMIVKLVKRYKK